MSSLNLADVMPCIVVAVLVVKQLHVIVKGDIGSGKRTIQIRWFPIISVHEMAFEIDRNICFCMLVVE